MPRRKDKGDIRPSRVPLNPQRTNVSALPLRELLREQVAAGRLSGADFDKAFQETVVIEIVADNRVLNRIERAGGPAAELIKQFKHSLNGTH
jgi:hypothetical protein